LGNCEKCGKEIDDNYKYCVECNNVIKQEKNKEKNKDIIRALGALNNNLYAIRRQQKVMLRESYKTAVVWDKKKKDFVEQKIE